MSEDYDPLHASLLDHSHLPPSSCLDRYRKAELQGIADAWLSLVKNRVRDTEYVLGQDLRASDLKAIIRRLSSAEKRL